MKHILFILLIFSPVCLFAQINNPNAQKPIKVYSVLRGGSNFLSDVTADASKYKYRVKCNKGKNRIIFMFDKYKYGEFVEKGKNEAPNFSTRCGEKFIFETIINSKKNNSIDSYVLYPGGNFIKQFTPQSNDSEPKWRHYSPDSTTIKYNTKIPCFLYYEDKVGGNTNEKYLTKKFGTKDLPHAADAASLKNLGHYLIFSYMIILEEQ